MKKILIIEDNQDIRENIAEILELADYKAITAENGKQGVEKATTQHPDLIICDIMMPELDGYGVLHILGKKEETSTIPFIFLTAKAERSDQRKGMSLGADDYITKPFDDTELLDAVEIRLKKQSILKKEYTTDISGLESFIQDSNRLQPLVDLKMDKKTKLYRKKHDVYRAGEHPTHLYLIHQGKVKTVRINEDGKELITGVYADGDFFGYEALLEKNSYQDSAETLEDTEVISIPHEEFDKIIFGHVDVARKFIEILSKKVNEKEEKLLGLAYHSVRQRTAASLLDLCKKFNVEAGEPLLSVSREDLANMVGTATESVIRVISDFREEGIVETKPGKITVLDLPKLEQIKKWHIAY